MRSTKARKVDLREQRGTELVEERKLRTHCATDLIAELAVSRSMIAKVCLQLLRWAKRSLFVILTYEVMFIVASQHTCVCCRRAPWRCCLSLDSARSQHSHSLLDRVCCLQVCRAYSRHVTSYNNSQTAAAFDAAVVMMLLATGFTIVNQQAL